MSVGWVAGSVRARLLDRHRLGTDGVRAVAASETMEMARDRLRGSAYADAVSKTVSVADAQHAVWSSVVWDLRVLAGWLPPSGVATLRTIAGFFEIENIEAKLLHLTGGDELPTFDLGSLATAWPRVGDAASAREVREQLRPSWPQAASDDPVDILYSLRLEWARRLSEIDVAMQWGAGAAALTVARALAGPQRPRAGELARRAPQLGHRAISASNLYDFLALAPDSARWVFDEVDAAEPAAAALWRAEAAWWLRLDLDGARLLRTAREGLAVVVGAVARRMADAWRTAAALDIASRGAWGEELVDVIA